MDTNSIKDLVSFLEKSAFNKIRIKQGDGFELELDKGVASIAMPVDYSHMMKADRAPAHATSAHPQEHKEAAPVKAGTYITSPMVGTYYSSPSPDQPVFVKVGDRVEENTVVCIIEAMKVMNEVKAGKSGIIAEILVDNSHPVEFGTKLFRIQ